MPKLHSPLISRLVPTVHLTYWYRFFLGESSSSSTTWILFLLIFFRSGLLLANILKN